MQIVSLGDNLHEMLYLVIVISCKLSALDPDSGKNKKNISKYRLLKILPRVLSINCKVWQFVDFI